MTFDGEDNTVRVRDREKTCTLRKMTLNDSTTVGLDKKASRTQLYPTVFGTGLNQKLFHKNIYQDIVSRKLSESFGVYRSFCRPQVYQYLRGDAIYKQKIPFTALASSPSPPRHGRYSRKDGDSSA